MSENFEIRIISLESQRDRREKIEKLFESQNVSWSFFDAIIGNDLNLQHPLWHHYDQKKRRKILGYDMRKNEIACFLSHRAIWKECVELKKPILILEDDIQLVPTLRNFEEVSSVMNNISNILGKKLFVRIGNIYKNENFFTIFSLGTFYKLVRFRRDPLTTMGYIISPQVAQRLLACSEKFSVPVDNFIWKGWEHDCCLLDLHPSIVFTSDIDTPSSIGDRNKPKIPIYKKIFREWYRFIQKKNEFFYQKSISCKF